ncbi:3-oxo-tetronate kinase [Streptomyces sp. NPDC059861]|uniref:3-oxo-tetronate kinase n=1 Tax=Streptomyces sp. NPDC059861 TaxID=3346974 RepID=UPI003661544B
MSRLGCVADDFTGATDLAGNLAATGRRVVVTVGPDDRPPKDADAVVVALKSRTVPPEEAVAACLDAHRKLTRAGFDRIWFKYCSTFDSTARGNIGPVTDALLEATGAPWTIACPAFPAGGRTVYQGHLFVGDRLLSESGMRHHPLTPMTDPDLVRVMGAQSRYRVGLLPHRVLRSGETAARDHVSDLVSKGVRVVVTDALDGHDLSVIERLTRDLPLITGGSGLALSLPPVRPGAAAARVRSAPGPLAVLAGSVSDTTVAQIRHARSLLPHRLLSVGDLVRSPKATVAHAVAWAAAHLDAGRDVLLYSADDHAQVRAAQEAYGVERSAQAAERALADCARALACRGVRRFLVAGGESSGAVVEALGVSRLRIGPAIAPGVSWTEATHGGHTLNLVLKSGNFGAEDLFTTAQDVL